MEIENFRKGLDKVDRRICKYCDFCDKDNNVVCVAKIMGGHCKFDTI